MKTTILFLFTASTLLVADEQGQPTEPVPTQVVPEQPVPVEPFKPFTGKIVGKKVRMRAIPTLDAPVVKQLEQGEFFVIVGERDDFYAVTPPKNTKLYINRKFVLDNVVDGNHVNVRLSPDLQAPIVSQLNSGDKVHGTTLASNNKWLEITPPDGVYFYIAKDYVENKGPVELYYRTEKERTKIQEQLTEASAIIKRELAKTSFEDVRLDQALASLKTIYNEKEQFPELAEQAEKLIQQTNDAFTQKKLAHLQSDDWKIKNQQLKSQIEEQKGKVASLEAKLRQTTPQEKPVTVTPEMAAWEPAEAEIVKASGTAADSFYQTELETAKTLHGTISAVQQTVRSRPGDYLLVNPYTNLPMAYLYSTKVNLHDSLGKEVTIKVAERPNHNFAFPAYFVLKIEE